MWAIFAVSEFITKFPAIDKFSSILIEFDTDNVPLINELLPTDKVDVIVSAPIISITSSCNLNTVEVGCVICAPSWNNNLLPFSIVSVLVIANWDKEIFCKSVEILLNKLE